MTDRDSVARFTSRRTTTRLWSSRDPESVKPGTDAWFANGDAGQFIRDEMRGGHVEKVMVDAEGPGVMTSAFFAGPAENTNLIVRLYIDGGAEPVVEAPAYAFADGGVFCGAPLSVALSPLTPDYWRRGHNLFLPIPFSRRLKLTCEIRPEAKWAPFYYNVQTIRYPVGTVVESYSKKVADRAASAIAAANVRLKADGPMPEGRSVSLDGCLAPGASVKRRFDGAGAIRYLSLRPRRTPAGCARGRDNSEMYLVRGSHVDFDEVEIVISFDGIETVRCPVGLLFGAGTFRAAEFRTWFSACSSDGRLESFWVMPFAESCEITLVNRSDAPVRIEGSNVVCGTLDFSKGEALRFGLAAVRRRDIPTRKRGGHYDLQLAELSGAGKIVGVGVSVVNRAQCWWGEGDPKIFIDGEKTPYEQVEEKQIYVRTCRRIRSRRRRRGDGRDDQGPVGGVGEGEKHHAVCRNHGQSHPRGCRAQTGCALRPARRREWQRLYPRASRWRRSRVSRLDAVRMEDSSAGGRTTAHA